MSVSLGLVDLYLASSGSLPDILAGWFVYHCVGSANEPEQIDSGKICILMLLPGFYFGSMRLIFGQADYNVRLHATHLVPACTNNSHL
jgi:hypothetical protein